MKIPSPLILIVWLSTLLLTACQSTQTISESGFGGTGAPVLAKIEDTSGFGGTGHSSSGFGGTGIIGTIEAFGSIWVNGIEIGYGDQTQITSNLSSTDSLELGQQVILETLPLADQTLTGKIHIHYPIAGKITETTDTTLVLDHQYRIRLNEQTHQDKGLKLTTGNYIAINGFQNADHSWTATRLNHNSQQKGFYQPEPQLQLSQHVTRWIIEPSLIQHNAWSILRPLQRNALQKHNQPIRLKTGPKHEVYQLNNPMKNTPMPDANRLMQQRLPPPARPPNSTRQLLEMRHEQNAIRQQQLELQRHQMQTQQKIRQDMKMGVPPPIRH